MKRKLLLSTRILSVLIVLFVSGCSFFNTYTVSYYANGADFGTVPSTITASSGDSVSVRGNTGSLTRENYSFDGWNTSYNGTGTAYDSRDSFSMPEHDVQLYAQWTPDSTYTVTYHAPYADSGSVPVDSNNYLEGSTVTVLGMGNLTRTNYTFLGWDTSSTGTVATYTVGTTLTMGTSDVDLYAVWTADPTYTVTYYGNGADSGSVPADSNLYLNSSKVTVLDNTGRLIREGYALSGWNVSSEGTGTSYAVGSVFTMETSDVDLYAEWVLISYTIIINNPEFPSISLSPTSLTLQSGGGTTSQEITVSTGSDVTIDSYTWIINGISRETDSSITLDTETHSSWFEIGRNTLTLVVEIDDLYYSDQFIFTVEQY